MRVIKTLLFGILCVLLVAGLSFLSAWLYGNLFYGFRINAGNMHQLLRYIGEHWFACVILMFLTELVSTSTIALSKTKESWPILISAGLCALVYLLAKALFFVSVAVDIIDYAKR